MLQWLLIGSIGYLLGSIPSGYLVGKAKGIDIRNFGSGATGGTNVQRTLGWGPAGITGVVDLLKGVFGGYVGLRLGGDWGYALGGFMAVVGHSYPVWLGFRGGKSVATGGGALLVQHPLAILAALVLGVGTIFPTRWVSLGSLVAGATAGTIIWVSASPAPHKLLALAIVLVIYVRHWENMKRIAAGTENKFGQKAKPRVGNPT